MSSPEPRPRVVPYLPLTLAPERRRAIVEGLRSQTSQLGQVEVQELIAGDRSLYRDYLWPAERAALRRLISLHRDELRQLALDDVLSLISEARPDLGASIGRDGGRAWLMRQWRELLSVALREA